jgi:hypothetical protein
MCVIDVEFNMQYALHALTAPSWSRSVTAVTHKCDTAAVPFNYIVSDE